MEKITIKVDGMSCEHCVKSVTSAVSALSGVSGVQVDLKSGIVSLEHDPAAAPLGTIKAAIEDQGFDVVA